MLSVYEELAEASRRAILGELRSGPKSVSELVLATGLKQPNVSNHLSRLRSKGIVTSSKIGRQVYYGLANPEIESIVRSVFAADTPALPSVDLDDLAKQYAKLAVAGDERGCQELLDRLLRAQVPLIEIYQGFLDPAMGLVGTWYQVEAIDEAQEHMASAITERMMGRAMHMNGPIRKADRTAVLGCAPNSWHTIGLRMVSDYLQLCGWTTYYLGANVPIPAFLETVRKQEPDLVLLSCSSEEAAPDTLRLIAELRRAKSSQGGFVIGVGGGCIRGDSRRFLEAGADFVSGSLRQFADELLPNIERHGSIHAESRRLPAQ
jgi:methanogenic corrinoid protein MtbC1